MTVKLLKDQQTASSSDEDSDENSSSAEEEEETDSESETEPVVDSKKVETASKPKTTKKSSTPVANPPLPVSNKVQISNTKANSLSKKRSSETDEGEEAKRVKRVSGDDKNKKSVEDASSSEEEETDSESDKKSVEDAKSKKVTNPVVKPPADSSSKVEASSKKRSIETDEGEAKMVKTISGEDDQKSTGQETKKTYFQRVWSEEDEIAVLQGILDYKKETGSSPFGDKNALYEHLKKSISFNASKLQFVEKIRSLKKKYDNNLSKWQKKGEEPAFSKPHDLNAFHLSKSVWGDDGIMANAIDVEPAVLKLIEPKQEFVSIVESVTRFGVDNLFATKAWIRLSMEDKKRFEEEWETLQLEELKFYSRKSRIIHDVMAKMAEQDH